MDIISNIGFNESAAKSKDVLRRVYEYFLGKFASAEGKGGGEFNTPQCVVQVLVAMLEPYKGRVFDPCCGSGGMFVQSEKFVEEHGGRVGETLRSAKINCSNRRKRWPCASTTTWKLARMNLAIRGIDAIQPSERPAHSALSMPGVKVHGLGRPLDFRHAIKKCRREGIDCFNCR